MDDPRYHTARWRSLREQIIRRDGRRCNTPGCHVDMNQPGKTIVDHIIEEKDGGPFWDPANLQILCHDHHQAKTADRRAERAHQVSPNA